MSRLVVISFGDGSLQSGFPRVTAQLWTAGFSSPEQFVGSLPPAPHLVELHQIWQSTYRCLCDRSQFRSFTANKPTEKERVEDEDDAFEIDQSGITNISQASFTDICQRLYEQLNHWLLSSGFIRIERQLRSYLTPNEDIRITIETHDDLLCRFPWHLWELIQDYPKTEISFSRSEYKRRQPLPVHSHKSRVRILAILGNSQGIDIQTDAQFLRGLTDADISFLVKPSRQQFNTALWDREGWDILFFAGHSQTQGQAGQLYINENTTHNSITIEQLEEALKAAIERGLKLAIFNSCDGLGLALAIERLHIPVVIAMREPVPNRVAQEFFKHFLESFAVDRIPFYQAMRQARSQLQGIEHEFPGASWLPIIYQNPAIEPPTWLQLGGIPPCPYRGLFAFQETDAHLFFGRETFTHQLATAVRHKPLIAVVGSSGSGKSSLVFAGLIPRLRRDGIGAAAPCIVSFRPGNNPFDAMAEAIAVLWQDSMPQAPQVLRRQTREWSAQFRQHDRSLATAIETLVLQSGDRHIVLVVDQFEELYTLCPEPDRPLFLDALLDAVQTVPAFTLVLTLRADFYGYVLSYRPFSDALQGAVYNLGPMSYEELQEAIEQPAAQMQVRLEQGLTDKLIQATSGSAGRLPLLEFALSQLWAKQQEGWLTHQAYSAIGGVEEALANHADAVYTRLSESDRQRMQRVFVQLVQPGIGTEASRRIANRDDIGEDNWRLVSTDLASARLVVTSRDALTGEDTVEIAHEALIRHWERLKNWIQVDNEFRHWQEDLRIARRRWERSDREEEALLRGKILSDAQHWYSGRQTELSSGDRQFIQLSLAVQAREQKKRKRKRQAVIASLVAGLFAALLLAGVAWWGWQKSALSEVQAIAASSEGLFASRQEFDALVESVRSQRKLQRLILKSSEIQSQVLKGLQQAVYRVVESNRLMPTPSNFMWGVAVSPDDQLIAAAGAGNTVHLWDRHGKELHTLKGHQDQVWGVAFSPNGQQIASASQDGTVKLWNLQGKVIQTLKGHTDAVWGVAFSPNGQQIASASQDGTVKLWNLAGKEIQTLKGHTNAVWDVAFSPNGQQIASASQDGTVKLWNLAGKEIQTLRGHLSRVAGVAFSPDGQRIASASQDGTVKLWNLAGKEIQTLKGHTDAVWDVAFSPDGQRIASASWDKTIKLWDRNGELLNTLIGHTARIRRVVFSANSPNQLIISSSEDKTIRLWRLNNTLLKILNGHRNPVIGISFSPNGQHIASASDDGTIKLWNQNGTLLNTLKYTAGVIGVEISPEGQAIAAAASDGSISIWNMDGNIDGVLQHTFQAHNNSVWDVAFSADGQQIISAGGDHTLKRWTLDGTLLQTFTGHSGEVREVAFSPDGKTIASASLDKTIKLWKLDGTVVQTFTGHQEGVTGLAFSPDGQRIASASLDKTIKLWKLDGTPLMTLKGHDDNVRGVAFSPDGRTIASASGDSSIKLWDQEGHLLNTLRGHNSAVWKVKFSPDGQTIASTSEDKTVILWNRQQVQNLDLLKFGCNWIEDYLKTNPDVSESNRRLCDGISTEG